MFLDSHDALPMNSTSNRRTESGGIMHEPVGRYYQMRHIQRA